MSSLERITLSSETRVELTETLSSTALLGRDVLRLGDIAACMAAERLARRSCVTVAVDECIFSDQAPGNGSTLVFLACVNRAWTTSCEVGLVVYSEYLADGRVRRDRLCSAYFSFVSVVDGVRSKLPPLAPDPQDRDPDSWRRFLMADERRKIRLARKELLATFAAESMAHSSSGGGKPRAMSLNRAQRAPGTCEKTCLVLPNNANHHGNLFGGHTMEWALECALSAGVRFANLSLRVVSVDEIFFMAPIYVGDRVTCRASTNRVFLDGTSMEVGVRIVCFSVTEPQVERHALSAFFILEPVDPAQRINGQIEPRNTEEGRRLAESKGRQVLRMQRRALQASSVAAPLCSGMDAFQLNALIAASIAQHLSVFKAGDDDWVTVLESTDPPARLLTRSKSDMTVMRIDCATHHMEVDALLHAFLDESERKRFDGALSSLEVLERVSEHDDIVRYIYFGKVELLVLRSWRVNVDGSGRALVTARSILHDRWPANEAGRPPRGMLASSGVLLSPADDGSRRVKVQYVVQALSTKSVELLTADVTGRPVHFSAMLKLVQMDASMQ